MNTLKELISVANSYVIDLNYKENVHGITFDIFVTKSGENHYIKVELNDELFFDYFLHTYDISIEKLSSEEMFEQAIKEDVIKELTNFLETDLRFTDDKEFREREIAKFQKELEMLCVSLKTQMHNSAKVCEIRQFLKDNITYLTDTEIFNQLFEMDLGQRICDESNLYNV